MLQHRAAHLDITCARVRSSLWKDLETLSNPYLVCSPRSTSDCTCNTLARLRDFPTARSMPLGAQYCSLLCIYAQLFASAQWSPCVHLPPSCLHSRAHASLAFYECPSEPPCYVARSGSSSFEVRNVTFRTSYLPTLDMAPFARSSPLHPSLARLSASLCQRSNFPWSAWRQPLSSSSCHRSRCRSYHLSWRYLFPCQTNLAFRIQWLLSVNYRPYESSLSHQYRYKVCRG